MTNADIQAVSAKTPDDDVHDRADEVVPVASGDAESSQQNESPQQNENQQQKSLHQQDVTTHENATMHQVATAQQDINKQDQATEAQHDETTYAVVQGENVTTLPHDLYIPPDALEVFLEEFSGPLDLLLYLIKRQNLNVLDIPISEITSQYMEYIDLMQEIRLELAAEYLVMAAMLAEIKSRMLLPRPVESEDEDDPRAELVRRLQEYERYKKVAEDINMLTRVDRDVFPVVNVGVIEKRPIKQEPEIELKELMFAFKDVLRRAEMFSNHHIQLEPLSVRERMSIVLTKINAEKFTDFTSLFDVEEGRMGVVVTLLAILELIKDSLLELVQAEPFGQIHVKAASSAEPSAGIENSESIEPSVDIELSEDIEHQSV